MKNLLKKFHIMSTSQSDETAEGSTSSRGSKSIEVSSSDRFQSRSRTSHLNSEHKPFSGISGWLNSVANRNSPSHPSSSTVTAGERMEPSVTSRDAAMDISRPDSGSSNSRDPDIEEEYQIQLALELSAREDPEAAQIEAVKQISLGSCDPDNTPAEVIAFRYWVLSKHYTSV